MVLCLSKVEAVFSAMKKEQLFFSNTLALLLVSYTETARSIVKLLE